MEYGFGAHDFPISGVFEVEPKTCPGFIFRRSIPLGRINMPPSEFRTFVETMASEYHGNTYHLISKNCNHFTDDIAWRLTGKHIPGWVNRLARMGMLSFARQLMFLFSTSFRFMFSVMLAVMDYGTLQTILLKIGYCSCLVRTMYGVLGFKT